MFNLSVNQQSNAFSDPLRATFVLATGVAFGGLSNQVGIAVRSKGISGIYTSVADFSVYMWNETINYVRELKYGNGR